MNSVYSCQPSANIFNQTWYLLKNDTIYATLSGMICAEYNSDNLSAKIRAPGVYFHKSYDIYDDAKSSAIIAKFEYSSMRSLPTGRLIFNSGEECTFYKIRSHCYGIRMCGVDYLHMFTINGPHFWNQRRLEIRTLREELKNHEFSLFVGWYMMIGSGMGLNDG